MNLTLLAFTSYKMMVHFISLVNQYIFHLLLQMYMECITGQIVKRVFLISSSFFSLWCKVNIWSWVTIALAFYIFFSLSHKKQALMVVWDHLNNLNDPGEIPHWFGPWVELLGSAFSSLWQPQVHQVWPCFLDGHSSSPPSGEPEYKLVSMNEISSCLTSVTCCLVLALGLSSFQVL